MFFRNNVPDEDRLSKELRSRSGPSSAGSVVSVPTHAPFPRLPGYAAYCCQCCWVSVMDAEVLAVGSPLDRWVCAGCSHR